MLSQLTSTDNGMFRPVSPPVSNMTHHIYMEIDPVYSQTADGQGQPGQHHQQLSQLSQAVQQLNVLACHFVHPLLGSWC